jgi:hypothetical protein
MEFDGGLPREKAEYEALKDVNQQGSKPQEHSEDILRALIVDKEHLIYLYGLDPRLCFIRTHSSNDDGTNFPIIRKNAENILREKYAFHSNYSHGEKRARVYIFKASPSDRRPKSGDGDGATE